MPGTLERIRVAGFGSLRDVVLEPGKLTVLVGANGSGKSNLLRALQMVPLMRTGSLQRFVGEAGGAASLLHYGPKQTPALELELAFGQEGGRNGYTARLGYAAGDKLLYLDETVSLHDHGALLERSLGAGHWESRLREEDDGTARSVAWHIGGMSFFHFHDTSATSALRTHARAEDDRYLRSDGSNLAAWLRRLEQGETEAERAAWRRINGLVHRVAPAVKALSPALVEGGRAVRLDWIDDRDERFGSHQLSDGTLRAIALITVFAQPADAVPRFVSIDEPELGLHPAAIALLADLARSVSHQTQVLFATQSTTFLDHFAPDEVVVVEREAGATTLRRPEPAALDAWLEDYTLAEVFEKGVLGGRP